jgi:predicted DNA-binding transcriptional regulator AlpA
VRKKFVPVKDSPNDLIADAECEKISGLGSAERYERIKNGTFPRPVNVAASPLSRKRSVRWIRHEVQSWVQQRVDERDREAAAERELARQDRRILGQEEQMAHLPGNLETTNLD